MQIKLKDINSVQPYVRNPRINDNAVDAVAASIREFGFRQPIVVDSDGVIIAGHVRYKAALKMGLSKVPVHVATDLTPEQIRAYSWENGSRSPINNDLLIAAAFLGCNVRSLLPKE